MLAPKPPTIAGSRDWDAICACHLGEPVVGESEDLSGLRNADPTGLVCRRIGAKRPLPLDSLLLGFDCALTSLHCLRMLDREPLDRFTVKTRLSPMRFQSGRDLTLLDRGLDGVD